MKKIFVILFFVSIGIFAQDTTKIQLKDSTLFKQYVERFNVYFSTQQKRIMELANKDSTARECQSVMNELKFLIDKEVKKQKVDK